MTEASVNRPPSLKTVVTEQVRVVGLAVRRQVIAVTLLIGIPTLLMVAFVTVPGLGRLVVDSSELRGLNLDPAEGWGILGALVGALSPLAVWKGEQIFGDTQLWLMPVARRRHALIKVGAGWVWLMGAAGALFLLLVLAALLTGGTFGGEETRLFVPDPAALIAGQVHPDSVTWTTRWWLWVLPFTTATVAYLLASALLLGTRHPWKWLGGGLLAFAFIGMATRSPVIDNTIGALLHALMVHPLGIDSLLTGGLGTLATSMRLPSGDLARIWTGLPSAGRWAGATLLWTGIGAACLYGALFRHRER